MNKSGPMYLVAQFAPRFLQIRRGTWLAIMFSLIGLFAMITWAAIAGFGWLWSQGKSLSESTPEAVKIIASQVEQAVPGAREALGDLVPALVLKSPPRDVSGTDIGPVGRYPGLFRSHWHHAGHETTVQYEGIADYAAVLDYYVKGFAAAGYVQNVLSATPNQEKHEYIKGSDRISFTIEQLPKGNIKATLVSALPSPTL